MSACSNCGEQPGRRQGLCDPCYQHWWRTGTDRPETNIIKHNTRRHEDEVVAKRHRHYGT